MILTSKLSLKERNVYRIETRLSPSFFMRHIIRN